MGRSIVKYCKKCDKEFTYNTGCGMLYFDLLNKENEVNLLKLCNSDDKGFIKEVLNNPSNYILSDNFSHEIYKCPNCEEVKEEFDYFLEDITTHIIFKPQHLCKKCNLKRRKIRAIDIKKCPICNSEFYNLDYILWD